jgi:hypothetical protein
MAATGRIFLIVRNFKIRNNGRWAPNLTYTKKVQELIEDWSNGQKLNVFQLKALFLFD